jgi:hypothetical protein
MGRSFRYATDYWKDVLFVAILEGNTEGTSFKARGISTLDLSYLTGYVTVRVGGRNNTVQGTTKNGSVGMSQIGTTLVLLNEGCDMTITYRTNGVTTEYSDPVGSSRKGLQVHIKVGSKVSVVR